MKETYTITVERPNGVSVADMKAFLRSALDWKNTLRFDDARNDIKISAINHER